MLALWNETKTQKSLETSPPGAGLVDQVSVYIVC